MGVKPIKMKNLNYEYVLNDFISVRIMQLSNQLNRQSVRILSKRSKLRLPEWRCITVIVVQGELKIGKIADTLSSDFGQVSRAVTPLEKMDYVVTERDKKDKRRVKVKVTPKGLEEFEKIMPILNSRQKLLHNCLEAGENKMLRLTMEKLPKVIEKVEATSLQSDGHLNYNFK